MSHDVVRMSDLTSDQRRLVLAMIDAGQATRGRKGGPAMTMIAEPGIQSDMQSEYSAVQTTVERIGPEEAERLLAKNTHNRPVKTRINDLSREMAGGRWILNGESIKVAASGTLIDGQHRLLAVVESGATIETVVVRGLPEATQETIDIGIKRSLADQLTLRGESSGTHLAAALTIAWKLGVNGHLFGGAGYQYPSNTELLGYLEQNPGIRSSVSVGDRLNGGTLRYPPSSATALHYLMSKLNPDQADEFWTLLNDGAGLLSGHPILTLRNYLVRDLSSLRRMPQVYRVAITIKAWNAYRAQRSIHVIKWVRSGDKPEEFPILK